MKKAKWLSVIGLISFVLFVSGSCATGSTSGADLLSAAPGTYENAAPAGLASVIALNEKLAPTEDELVIYYVRADKNYAPWALWMWALPDGDGAAAWPKTQNWTVEDGIGYMRFKMDGSDLGVKPVGSDGQLGLIVRQKDDWIKDGQDDRFWDTKVSKSIAIFSGNMNTYAAEDYKPKALTAVLTSETEIQVMLSGRYGLDTDGGPSGFTVETKDGGKVYKIAKVFNTDSPKDYSYNYTRTVTIELAEPAGISEAIILKNPVFEGDKQIDGSKLAISLAESSVPGKDITLGAVYDAAKKSVTFNLWAPTSSAATVQLYRRDTAASPDFTVPMTLDKKTGVWTAAFSQTDPDGLFYDILLTNSGGTKAVLDPYARSMAAYRNTGGSGRAAVVNLADSRALPAGGMSAPYVKLEKRENAIIYEMSVRDFTISPDANVKAPPGTYNAFIEKIPYLKSLGVTHIQLMPVLNFYFTDETDRKYENSGTVSDNNYNWGYDPHNYFTPEGWYATDASNPYSRVAELRNLINECHKAGLGVLLDVVYNHMANTTFLEDIVPGYFFRMNADGKFTSNSGCGNDVATERAMARRLIVDSVAYWVKEYKVDGFRFDLMGLMDTKTVLDAYAAAKAINPDVLFEGEGWKMYNGPAGTVGMDQNYMTKTDSVAVFNDEFRDLLKAGGFNEAGRGFLTKRGPDTERLYKNILGQPQVNYKADSPGDNMQYIAAHDGLTLHDTISHNAQLDDSVPEQRAEIAKRIKLGNFFVMTSQGIAFMHGGQERGRTKPNLRSSRNETIGNFVRNSYDSSDNINQVVWTLNADYQSVLDYTASMINLRKTRDVFRIGDMATINKAAALLPNPEDSRLTIGYTLDWTDGKWFVLVNAELKPMTFDVGSDVSSATVFADAGGGISAGKKLENGSSAGVSVQKNQVTIEPLTAIILRTAK
ncbi:alpha-amylase [Brucepastera parasyntrophica]|uniref:alpha-amylase family glycosyl hydrolase n=1 Tax=Brucepastera parasyntrophica TaxID=2880008 RepID=UPI0021093093|nr:alpha-amylase family glycosyl hydrolase [Brucepastera parasyntrophica]ULQ60952.1 alpha-amylase [Brucepastera parasyntrophica]